MGGELLLGVAVSSDVSRVDGRLAGEVGEAGSEVEVDVVAGAALACGAAPPSLH